MVELDYLKHLLALAKGSGLASLKTGDLELSFHVEQSPLPSPASLQDVPIDEHTLPPDLRSDTLMNMDSVLNWSSPNADAPMPLIEEESL